MSSGAIGRGGSGECAGLKEIRNRGKPGRENSRDFLSTFLHGFAISRSGSISGFKLSRGMEAMRKNILAMMAAWIATTGIAYGQQPNDIPPVPAPPNWPMPLNPQSSKEPPPPVTYSSSPLQQQPPPGFDVGPRSGWNELSAPPGSSEMLPTPHVAFPSPYSDIPPCWRVCGWFNEDFLMVFMPPQMLPPN